MAFKQTDICSNYVVDHWNTAGRSMCSTIRESRKYDPPYTKKRVFKSIFKRKRTGVVYFIQGEETKLIKIGMTSDAIEVRLKNLQACSPDNLILLKTIKSPNFIKLERQLHTRFKKYRKHGEWFQASKELLDFIY